MIPRHASLRSPCSATARHRLARSLPGPHARLARAGVARGNRYSSRRSDATRRISRRASSRIPSTCGPAACRRAVLVAAQSVRGQRAARSPPARSCSSRTTASTATAPTAAARWARASPTAAGTSAATPAEVFESIYQGRPDGMPAWGIAHLARPDLDARHLRAVARGERNPTTENSRGRRRRAWGTDELQLQ